MKLHIVAGFLGSGKTTAIMGACKRLMAKGQRVGVITNDQGKYLVDTAFFQMEDVPAVEVTGGCFCCNYDDLEERLAQLQQDQKPDVIFAESVGSCADIVATVVNPLLNLRESNRGHTSYSTFCDARLLLRRLRGQPMPFADDVVYIFDQQLDEAALIVINKIDLLNDEDLVDVLTLARSRYPTKHLAPQVSLDDDYIRDWLQKLDELMLREPITPLMINYDRYGQGEMQLAWLDQHVHWHVPANHGRDVAIAALRTMVDTLAAHNAPIGHLKIVLQAGDLEQKVSFPTLAETGWETQIPELPGFAFTLLINARVQASAQDLKNLIAQALDAAASETGTQYHTIDIEAFHPGQPVPSHTL